MRCMRRRWTRKPGHAAIPLIWGHGCRTRQCQDRRCHRVSAQHRHRRDARSGSRAPDRRRDGEQRCASSARTGRSRPSWPWCATTAGARTYESYGEEPDGVSENGAAIIEGLQGKPGDADFMQGGHVIATAKHFLGDGGTDNGVDQGDNALWRGGAARSVRAILRSRDRRRRADSHGVLFELARPEDARQPRLAERRAGRPPRASTAS
jgi:hypothetical protein